MYEKPAGIAEPLRITNCLPSRSESPISSRSSPSISPGCEDYTDSMILHEMGHPGDFKKPIPSHVRPNEFPPMYANYPYHLMPGASAFHRPMDGKPIPVRRENSLLIVEQTLNELHLFACPLNLQIAMGHGFMPQHFQIEYLARAGMLHPRFPDLTGELLRHIKMIPD